MKSALITTKEGVKSKTTQDLIAKLTKEDGEPPTLLTIRKDGELVPLEEAEE